MRSVQDHLQACLSAVGQLPPLAVQLPDAVGCILAEDVRAPSDLPVADLAALDGYAVRSADVAAASARPVRLRVVDDLRAGDTDVVHLVDGAVVRLASGAPLPVGADAVVPLEGTDQGDATVTVLRAVVAGENVRPRAIDARSGDVVLAAGERVGARQEALLAAVGRARVSVHPKPRVVIVSVGDELLEPGRPADAGQVYDANGHALATGVQDVGAVAFRVSAVPDRIPELREVLEDQLVRADLLITTGGLSANDTVRDVVGQMGSVRFDRVAILPGRRFGVGHVGEEPATPVFCLPGDPLAVQVAYEAFVRPALRSMAGHAELFRPSVPAVASVGWDSPARARQFVPVQILGSPSGGYRCEPVGPVAMGTLSALAHANALAVIPEDVTRVAPGDQVSCLILDA
ncbi:MAG: gephyrin-like molybdotransferase Glp [Actinomycetota bacterium]